MVKWSSQPRRGKRAIRCLPALSLLLALLTPTVSLAQPNDAQDILEMLAGTLSVQASSSMSKGRLSGCFLLFEHLQQDTTYLSGNYLKTSGSVGFMSAEGNVGFVMKAVAFEVDASGFDVPQKKLPLDRIYLLGSDFQTNFDSLISTAPSNTSGAVFSIFQLDPGATLLLEAFPEGQIVVAIAPVGGSADIQLPIDLTVVETKENGERVTSHDSELKFFECLRHIMAPEDPAQ